MSRLPNPWVLVPIVVAAVAGGAVGYLVTDASCAPTSCTLAASVVGVLTALGSAAGIGIVVVLAFKSLSEWRDHADREVLVEIDDEPQGPPTC